LLLTCRTAYHNIKSVITTF